MAVQWNASFETNPGGGESPSLGDDVFRTFKLAVRERVEKEHWNTTADGTATGHGFHKNGSARAFFTQAKPTLCPDGATALTGVFGKGRLLVRSNMDNIMCVWNGTTWAGIIKEITRASIQGTLAVGTNALPAICFVRTVTVNRVMVRVGTKPSSTQTMILDLKKNGSASIFNGTANRPLISNGGNSYVLRTSGQLSTLGLNNLNPSSYLTLDIVQAGSVTKAANLSIVIEVGLK